MSAPLTASSPDHRAVRRGAPVRARLWATFLVLLIALPFTAPFSTCDLATLLGAPAPHAIEHSLGSSTIDATTLAPVVTMEEDEFACEIEAPLAVTEPLAVAAPLAVAIWTSAVVPMAAIPLRL